MTETAAALNRIRPHLQAGPVSARQRYQLLGALGGAASRYRESVYRQETFSGKAPQPLDQVRALLDDALAIVDHTIESNVRDDGLYHAYNLLHLQPEAIETDNLYPMLEGQVAALSSGAIAPARIVGILETLFESDMFRADQHSFMLYPDRRVPGFLEKNRISIEEVESIAELKRLVELGDNHIVERDEDGCYRFNARFRNVNDLNDQLDALVQTHGPWVEQARPALLALYEKVFNHKAFTGRSGSMFGFEGLGCIYWHMVSKLLLAAQENFFLARAQGEDPETCNRLAHLYYRIRAGLGFNKTPAEYGAFPMDPYSHTPGHAGAQQPGMTGQVKEEVLTRFAELGVRVSGGAVHFDTGLLRACEFVTSPSALRYLDVDGEWQQLTVPEHGLAFTWCQVPVVYRLDAPGGTALTLDMDDGSHVSLEEPVLTTDLSTEIFMRSGRVRRIELALESRQLFAGQQGATGTLDGSQ